MKKQVFFILFLFHFFQHIAAQELPVLKQQVGLDEVSGAISHADGNNMLVKSGENNYTLIDQVSKIQLGTVQVDIGSISLPGLGLAFLTGSHRFIVSDGRVLLEHDFLRGKTDTVFNAVRFPEFIINCMPLPGEKNKLLIAVKKYPVDAKGNVYFEKADAKNNRVFDDSRNCRLLLYDLTTRAVLKSVPVNFAVTCFAITPGENNSLLAGTFDGDVLKVDTSLQHTKLFHAFNAPVHSLQSLQGVILTIPHLGPKFIGTEGEGRLLFYTVSTAEKKIIQLPEQIPVQEERDAMKLLPSSQVKKTWTYTPANAFLVNYGFSRLLQVNLPGLDTINYPVDYVAADFYCFNRDSTQLLAAATGRVTAFGVTGGLLMYGLQRKKAESFFRKPAVQEEFKQIVKLWDRDGNYHILAKRSNYFVPDTIVIFSSNNTNPSFLIGPNGAFTINPEDTSLTISKSGRLLIGKLKLEKLSLGSYRFSIGSRPGPADSLQAGIFQLLFDSKQHNATDIPYGISGVKQAGDSRLLLTGYSYAGNNTVYSVLILDSNGKTLFKAGNLETGIFSDFAKLSPSGKFIALYRQIKTASFIELWDWKQNRKIFSRTFSGNERPGHFCFDKTKDICWFSNNRGDKGFDIFRIDPAAATIKAELVFNDPSFISFETDMQRDLVAVESYNQLHLLRLSNREIVWENYPFSSGFSIGHLPGGFAWSSEREMHIVTNGNDHLHFTSFAPYRPVEVLNGYLYRGEKQAVNNLAFVYRGKGYLPGDFDIYFNRPDSVLPRAGSANNNWNQVLAKTVAKRLRYYPVKNLSDVLQSAPQLTVTGREKIPDLVHMSELKLPVEVNAGSGDAVTVIHILDNGVPVYGKKGRKLQGNGAGEEVLSIPLVKGLNRLQLIAETRNGLLSAPEYISVEAEFPVAPGRTWFLGIGVSRYRDTLMNLRYADKDIRDLAADFSERFPGAETEMLLNENATLSSIRTIKEKLMRTSPEDRVVLSFSGHGLVDSSGNFYFATHDMEFARPAEKGMLYEEMENLLADIPARKRLLWIDACHSGEVDRELLADSLLTGADASVKAYGAQRGGVIVAKGKGADLQNSFELMRELFTDVGRSGGTVVISAAGGLEYALEDEKWQNGVFTYSIKKGLLGKMADQDKDGRITVNELREYVSRSVEILTGGRQKPTTRKELAEFDWELW